MRKMLAAAVLAASVGVAGGAYAADLNGGYKDVPAYVPVNTWAGFYFGANGGYGWSANSQTIGVDATDVLGIQIPGGPVRLVDIRGADAEGGFGGAQIGYNIQRGHFVVGAEADIQISDINGNKTTGLLGPITVGGEDDPATISLNATHYTALDWFGTVRGRLGYAFDNVLVYFTGGLAYGRVVDEFNGDLNISDGRHSVSIPLAHLGRAGIDTGYVVGGGIEYKPFSNPNWSVKAEYQYINLGSDRVNGSALGIVGLSTTEVDHAYNTARVGLNYHIPNGYEPLK